MEIEVMKIKDIGTKLDVELGPDVVGDVVLVDGFVDVEDLLVVLNVVARMCG